MPVYRFEAMNAQGQTIKNEIDAVSEEEAIQKIRAQKLFPTNVKVKSDPVCVHRLVRNGAAASDGAHRLGVILLWAGPPTLHEHSGATRSSPSRVV